MSQSLRTTQQSSSYSSSSTSGGQLVGGGQASEEQGFSYRPHTAVKSVVINRVSGGGGRSRASGSFGLSGGMSSRMSMVNFNPQVYGKLADTNIVSFRGDRQREKKEMQDLNERFADYVEKVRYLEAQNKMLQAENEALRNRKDNDWRPVRDMFESELDQARKVIAELSTEKGVSEAKIASLQDEVASLREVIATYESNARDYIKKIDQLNSQIGEYEGEVTTLRLRCGSLEDELAKLRALLQKYKDENMRLRADLDAETAAHIEQEVLAQTCMEENEFLKELLEKVNVKQEPITIKGMDTEAFFKGELKNAVSSMQAVYDEKMETMQMDLDAKYAAQMTQLRSGTVRDTMETEHAKSEVKRMRDQLAKAQARIAELEALLASMKCERDDYALKLSTTEADMERLRLDMTTKVNEMQMQIESLVAQLQELISAKVSLELEITCYKKLLEGEENRTGLRQLVEQTIGVRGGGAEQLAGIIGGQSSMSTARTTVQRSSKGPVAFQGVDASGSCVIVENTSFGNRAQTISIKGWKIVKKIGTRQVATFTLGDITLGPGKAYTIFAKGAKSVATSDEEAIADMFSWGAPAPGEQCDFSLLSEQGDEKATLTQRVQA